MSFLARNRCRAVKSNSGLKAANMSSRMIWSKKMGRWGYQVRFVFVTLNCELRNLATSRSNKLEMTIECDIGKGSAEVVLVSIIELIWQWLDSVTIAWNRGFAHRTFSLSDNYPRPIHSAAYCIYCHSGDFERRVYTREYILCDLSTSLAWCLSLEIVLCHFPPSKSRSRRWASSVWCRRWSR